ncbi:DctP family TRAP transporter solute-binding subunit [candidate division KSB3 bacterium]|uniref:DctP family TRAP transporter solute-binding subunit n=1 Tax=candidate division KSB3 bacterium TaxID=2044937 RepID=A0A9D5JTL7_9BACT|nr:DctP family TRAP transporter solute-binding subunit [candidate division KSB3 bacterium]MBD3324018.1 DctP family TRAP transporter solute-binding subunit [candidate division KSB3 bacterium]
MKHRGVVIIIAVLVIGLVANMGLAQDKKYTLRFNTVGGPNEPQTLSMQKFADVVGNLSGGNIEVKVFHSGQLADQKTSILGIMRGSGALEMSSDASPSWFADLADYPEIGVLEAAYVYRDIDHAYRVLLGPFGQKYWDALAEKSGIRVLDVWYLGTRQLDLTEKAGPVKTPEDLEGIKLRMPNSEAWLNVGRALGANPTPLGFGEVYMALKTGTIDGQDNPLPTDFSEKFYEVTHYIVLTDHVIAFIMPIINEDLWQEMPEKYRVYIKKALQVARYHQNRMVLEQEAELIGKFEKEFGMEIIIPDKQAFMEHAKEFYSQDKFQEMWGEGMYSKIQTME